MTEMLLAVQQPFDFQECLVFLSRSEQEVLHVTTPDTVRKLMRIGERLILIELQEAEHHIRVRFPVDEVSDTEKERVAREVRDWLDLERDLKPFETMGAKNELLAPLIEAHRGLRMIGFPDLFEALTWAIIGQQITLSFAYTIKRRFVERYGDHQVVGGRTYWTFPRAERIALLEPEELRELQFSRRKAEYVIDIAREITNGDLSKTALQSLSSANIRERLLAIRGVGEWTADYVLMKCFQDASAFPIADVGLHQAIQHQLGTSKKPTIEEVKRYGESWQGWEGYATFYLWRSLYGNV
ncbi:DNA-3-methyladenine glycosylase II [Exiguobacterium sp. 8H]|uniref:DNA-3-methyladenine glycosylase family protein n=1 Tax=unclassified Exiguobacterium TaxID=2644629 RepID=UPI0012F109B2|nr:MULTISPECIES: DNA-3-methyladenine glycosylase [unclassified Exiguobacterium]VXB88914.1 DNA-3-methyladenine glycosylase II [Exiguobacterium sp. 8H]VXC08332.1 DNA-3-methyladenine glycosylase II [Exiguobacterium sp. 8A]